MVIVLVSPQDTDHRWHTPVMLAGHFTDLVIKTGDHLLQMHFALPTIWTRKIWLIILNSTHFKQEKQYIHRQRWKVMFIYFLTASDSFIFSEYIKNKYNLLSIDTINVFWKPPDWSFKNYNGIPSQSYLTCNSKCFLETHFGKNLLKLYWKWLF